MKKSSVLRKAIMERRALAAPGCHDALSAKVIEECGYEAIQVSGFGVAGSYLGQPDVGIIRMKEVIEITGAIARAVQIPVMADADTGGGNAINAAWVTERLIELGLAGMNIEDQVFPKRCGHMAGKEVIPAEEMVGKIRAVAEVRDRLDKDFIINARTDCFASLGIEEAIRRCKLYAEAGADLVFVDAIRTREDITRVIESIDVPLSVNLMDGVTGVKTELIPVPELAKMGVGRVSIPVASVMVAYKALKNFFTAMHDSPTGTLPGQTEWVPSFQEYTDFVGLSAYRELEKKYLPGERFAEKYK